MNETEIARIAAATNALRPDWPIASLTTLLRDKLASRARRDVAVAMAWVACESSTKTPARVLEAGPWWQAVADDAPKTRQPYEANKVCSICSRVRLQCEAFWSDDHEFLSVAEHRRRRPIPNGPWPDMPPAEFTEGLAREFDAAKEATRQQVLAAKAELRKATTKDGAA